VDNVRDDIIDKGKKGKNGTQKRGLEENAEEQWGK
tara:strand:+ start:2159 stop:2263 length:105 start_codon:yes stop_codon:yes gene_type:complete